VRFAPNEINGSMHGLVLFNKLIFALLVSRRPLKLDCAVSKIGNLESDRISSKTP
jgi:hypothetical protein